MKEYDSDLEYSCFVTQSYYNFDALCLSPRVPPALNRGKEIKVSRCTTASIISILADRTGCLDVNPVILKL